MGWSGGRPRAIYISSVQIIGLIIFVLFAVAGLMIGIVSNKATNLGFAYLIGTAIVSFPIAWALRKIYYRFRKFSRWLFHVVLVKF